jgi:hypothetical protein
MNIKRLGRRKCEEIWGDGSVAPSVSGDLTTEENVIRDSSRVFLDGLPGATEYNLDWQFALELYFHILPLTGAFTLRDAADNDLWRRLALQVIPDLVERRWPAKDGIHSKDHFWAKPQRNWLKSLWWYGHLSCQNGDRALTAACMKRGSTDSIQHIVERPGPGGFRVDLCRELLKRLGDCTLDVSMLKKVLKLNTSRVCLIEPELYSGGVSGYVDSLVQSIQ